MNGGTVVTDQPSGGGSSAPSGPLTESGQIVVLATAFQNVDSNVTQFVDNGDYGYYQFNNGNASNAHAPVSLPISGGLTITGVQAIFAGNTTAYNAEISVRGVQLSAGAAPVFAVKAHLQYGPAYSGNSQTVPIVDSTPIVAGQSLEVKVYVATGNTMYLAGVILNYTRTIT